MTASFASDGSVNEKTGLLQLGPMFVINLASRADRRKEFAAELARLGLGFDGEHVRLFEAVRPPEKGSFPSLGARGCFMSHLGILRQAEAEGLEQYIVCEDDLNFSRDFTTRLPAVLAELQSTPWDIFYPGSGDPAAPLPKPGDGGSGLRRVESDEKLQCTHFIVFRRSAISQLGEYLENMLERPAGHPHGGPMHVDGAFNHFRADHPGITTLVSDPPLGHQRPSRTDIHDLRWYDRTPFIRDLTSLARRARSR